MTRRNDLTVVLLGARALPGSPEAPAGARRFVRSLLSGRPAEDAELLTSELVTNAYKHTRSGDGTVTVAVLDIGHAVRVEVIDEGGTDTAPEVRADDPDSLTGRGLYMVERIADRWGTLADQAGRVTWFELGRGR